MERSQFAWSAWVRLACVIALAASAALLADYSNEVASFCAPGSGCDAVKQSAYSALGGVPTPVLGLGGFTVLLTLSLAGGVVARRLLLPVALPGALGALTFIGLQVFVIRHLCWLCMTVDSAALVAAVGAWGFHRRPSEDPLRLPAWSALALLAVVAPLTWPLVRPQPPVPASLQALYVPGKVTVVEFSDFECPYCRLLHRRLKELLPAYGERVVLRRLNKPLNMHPNARHAARGALCAEQQHRGEAMADALFSSRDLSPAGVEAQAGTLGLDLESFRRCVTAPETDQRIAKESAILDEVGFKGLPTTFIGDRVLLGAQETYVFQQAIERAAKGVPAEGVPGWLYLTATATLSAVILGLGWPRRRRSATPS